MYNLKKYKKEKNVVVEIKQILNEEERRLIDGIRVYIYLKGFQFYGIDKKILNDNVKNRTINGYYRYFYRLGEDGSMMIEYVLDLNNKLKEIIVQYYMGVDYGAKIFRNLEELRDFLVKLI